MSPKNVLEQFCAVAATAPGKLALAGPARRVTYGELAAAADRLASFLLDRGCARGALVAVLLRDPAEIVTALLGIWKAGGIYVPLEPSQPRQRLQALWAQAPADWLLAESASLDLALDLAAGTAGGATVLCLDGPGAAAAAGAGRPGASEARLLAAEYQEHESGEPVLVPTDADELCYVFFTSGSTGTPKGIAGRRKGVDHFIEWETEFLAAGAGLRVSQLTSPAFDAFLRDVFLPLANGGTLCVPPSREALLDAGSLLAWLGEQAVQVVHCVPTLFRTLLGQAGRGLAPGSLPHLRHVLLSGEALLPGDVRAARSAFGHGVRLVNLYGPTETTMTKLFHVVEPADAERRTVPIGRPMPGCRALVVDESNRPSAPGKIGEILLRTPFMSLGYYRQPELTRQVFVPNPFASDPRDLVYRTGDLGKVLPDGSFELLGRRDLQVKIRGMRVELGEIEGLLREQPGVSDAAVVARPGPDGNLRLCAFVASPESGISGEALRGALLERLPEAMVPSLFAPVDELPRTLSGKVDRAALARRPIEEPRPAAEGEGPRTPAEELLAQIWTEVLGVRQVARHDNFFAVGGHSVLAAQVLARVRVAFGVEVPLRAFFEAQTLISLAQRIEDALRGAGAPRPAIEPVPRDGVLPLSFSQERLWFLDQLTPGSAAYNLHETVRLDGPLAVAVLARSLAEVVRRHEVLRTSFAAPAGQPVQVIAPELPPALPVVDLAALPPRAAEPEVEAIAAAAAARPFDLARAPLLRLTLLRLSREAHRLLVTLHHIASDAWSMGLLVREAVTLYRAFRQDRPSPLPELPVQYADYAVWQRRWLHEEALAEQLAFWRRQLAGAPASLELPTDRPRPAVPSERGGHLAWSLPGPLCSALRQLGRQRSTTLFMGLLAAWSALLSRLSGQADLCLGTPIAGRDHLETEALIGFFVNLLVLRVRPAPGAGFAAALDEAREAALAAFSHRDLPFAHLVEALQPPRSLQLTPFFQVLLVLHNVPRQEEPGEELGGLVLRGGATAQEGARFDLTLRASEQGEALAASFEYAAELFDRATVERLAGQLATLLRGALDEPLRPLAELPLLAAAQRHQLVVEWNDTRRDDVPRSCIHGLIAAQAARTPEALAVVCGDAALSYRGLAERAGRLALRLRRLGVGPDGVVALCLKPSLEVIVALLAVLEAGGAYLPLDPQAPRERLLLMLEDTPVGVAIAMPGLRDLFVERGAAVLSPPYRLADSAAAEEPRRDPDVTPRNLAYVICTSGSTGRPKAVGVEHRSLVNYVVDVLTWLSPRPGTTSALVQPLTFDSCVTALYPPLVTGGCLQVVAPEVAIDAHALAAELARRPAAGMKIAPSHLAALHGALPGHAVLPWDWLVLGGELAHASWLGALQADAPGCAIIHQYGPTEATVGALVERFGAASRAGFSEAAVLRRPYANIRAYLLDGHRLPVPPGVAGTLFLAGDCLARGYLGRPELTAQRFLPDPHGDEPGARMYDTGDLMRRTPAGPLVFCGRLDHQVKVRGFRIELGEIEAALRRHPGVREAVVRVVEETPGRQGLVAYAVARQPEPVPDLGELRRFLADKLPDYMHPSALVVLAELPRNAHGKLDLKALPVPTLEAPSAGPHLPPRTAVEEVLAGLWSEALGLAPISAGDDFFALGGHSLLATRLVAAVRAACDVDLAVRDLFEAPTVRGLAARVEQARAAGRGLRLPPIAPAPRHSALPLSFDQRRLWFLDQLEPGNPFYNRCDAVRLRGLVDLGVLVRCFDELVRRHESLRTRFPEEAGQPVQVVAPPAALRLPCVDLSALPADRREAEARRRTAEELRIPFDLARGPLLRVRVFRLSREEHVIGLSMHHIIWDGGSTGILVSDLVALYRAFAAGEPSPLPPLPVQYADFACWQQEHLRGDLLEEQLAYWRHQLAGVPRLELATDHVRPAVQGFRGSDLPVALPPALVAGLRGLARQRSATLFMVVLAAFDVLLHARSGSPDVVVSVPAGNRGLPELEPLIGFFVNMLSLRARLAGETRFTDLVDQVRKSLLDGLAHMQVPFDRVVNSLRLPRDLAYSTLTQVSFVLGSAMETEARLPGLSWERLAVAKGSVQYELNLTLGDTADGGLAGLFEYSTELFERATAARMVSALELVLETVVARPEVRVEELVELLAESDRRELAAAGRRQLGQTRRRAYAAPLGN